MSKQIHLTLLEREIIEKGIKEGASKAAIASTLDKDPSTIAKEIRLHRSSHIPNFSNGGKHCIHIEDCKPCSQKCPRFVEVPCKRKDRSPGACNGCSKRSTNSCKREQFLYDAKLAHQEYESTLSDSRSGINLTIKEFKRFTDIVVPLLNNGLSPYHIVTSHPELKISEKTLYNYIEWGYFSSFHFHDVNLKRKVKFKQRDSKQLRKRKESRHYLGRMYKDYQLYCEQSGNLFVPQMDTIYNSVENGPFLQTFVFPQSNLLLAILHEAKTSECMIRGINLLDECLGDEVFKKLFPAILTDRGSEFAHPEEMEFHPDTKEKRTQIFYCNPMQSSQKPQIEKAHTTLREILPKDRNLTFLTQEKLTLICSHVNGFVREALNGKSSYEAFTFLYGTDPLNKLGIKEIKKDHVKLVPTLVK